ncbi:MAG: PIN domain-containing protein [Sphingorhabdus sp.]
MILVDSNILIDVLDRDPVWYEWSFEQMADASKAGRVAINHIVVAEVVPFSCVLDDFLAVLENMGVEIEVLCNQSAYSAGMAFQKYRKRRDKGAPKTILPDFLIGGHAQALDAAILTRDPRFYRTYFPLVPLITPLKDEND